MERDPSAADRSLMGKLCPNYGYDWCPVIATRWWLDALRLRDDPRFAFPDSADAPWREWVNSIAPQVFHGQ
jgi:hypothetical protein